MKKVLIFISVVILFTICFFTFKTTTYNLNDSFTCTVNDTLKIVRIDGIGELDKSDYHNSLYKDYTLVIGDGVTAVIGSLDFKRIYFGKDIEKIDNSSNFKYSKVSEENKNFASYRGNIYSKDFRKLILASNMKKHLKLHKKLKVIEENAFGGYISAKILVIPWGVTEIKDHNFNSLTDGNVILPDTLIKFEGNVSQYRGRSYLYISDKNPLKASLVPYPDDTRTPLECRNYVELQTFQVL